jgi:hypothetical protein
VVSQLKRAARVRRMATRSKMEMTHPPELRASPV